MIQGSAEAPSYQAVCSGRTGHTEAVQVCQLRLEQLSAARSLPNFSERSAEPIAVICNQISEARGPYRHFLAHWPTQAVTFQWRTVLQVYYDPSETSYDRLLELFFERVDPTTKDRQGNDAGSQYRSGIYFHNDEQMAAAEKVRLCFTQSNSLVHRAVL